MGRWSHLDTDEERLPDGMTRVGYDGDTQIYTYQDNDGSYWEGAPGVKYGRLYRVHQAAPVLPSAWVDGDITGHEPDYVLHDYDSSPDENRPAPTSFSQIFGEDDDADADSSSSDGSPTTPNEKRRLPRSTRLPSFPSKAVIHPSIKRKPVLNLPTTTTNTTTNTADRMSIASTLVDRSNSLRSNLTTSTSTTTSTVTSDRDRDRDREMPTAPGGGSGLRRSGTLSRLAQFLSTSTSGIARRATVTGEAGMAGHGHRGSGVAGRRRGGAAGAGAGASAGENGRWPAASPGTAGFAAGAGAGADAGGAARAARARKRATTFDDILGPGQ